MANEIGNIGGTAATGAGLGSMLMPGVGTAVGAGAGGILGLLKSIIDSDNEKKDRISQSVTTRYSPWTGLKAQAVEHSNGLGDIAAGVAGGAQTAQGLQKAQSDNDLLQARTKALAARGQAAAPIVTPAEAGKAMGPAPQAAAPQAAAQAAPQGSPSLQDLLGGRDPDQVLKILRTAMAGRQGYSGMA